MSDTDGSSRRDSRKACNVARAGAQLHSGESSLTPSNKGIHHGVEVLDVAAGGVMMHILWRRHWPRKPLTLAGLVLCVCGSRECEFA
jgi:hypothetical protein